MAALLSQYSFIGRVIEIVALQESFSTTKLHILFLWLYIQLQYYTLELYFYIIKLPMPYLNVDCLPVTELVQALNVLQSAATRHLLYEALLVFTWFNIHMLMGVPA